MRSNQEDRDIGEGEVQEVQEVQVEVTWIGINLGNVSFQRCPTMLERL